MNEIKEYIGENSPRFLEELFSLLRIPSVSSQKEHKQDMQSCAERYAVLLMEAGVDRVEIYPTQDIGSFAEKIIDPSKPTVLVYGHYDVQPEDPPNCGKHLLSNRWFATGCLCPRSQ
jgi:acetylornithine deacetylase/succinyl-diaminopimelate desuccinylase-like protein